MKAPWSKMPALPVAIGLIGGIMLYGEWPQPWLAISALALSVAGLFFARVRYWATGLLALAIGWQLGAFGDPPDLPQSLENKKVEIIGTVTDVSGGNQWVELIVRADSIGGAPVLRRMSILAKVDDSRLEILRSSRIRLSGVLHGVGQQRVPIENQNQAGLKAAGVSAVLWTDRADVAVLENGSGLQASLDRFRYRIISDIYSSDLSGPSADLVVAMVLGRDEYLNPSVRENFRLLGISHLLALSGFHVAVFAGILLLLFQPLNLIRRWSKYRYLPVMVVVWLYVIMVGMPASAVRAAILLTILLTGRMLYRSASPYNSLAIAAIVIVVTDPMSVFSIGFQLSFAAVLGLLAFGNSLNPVNRRHQLMFKAVSVVTIPVAATLGTCTLTMAYFHSFPLMFLVSNVLICLVAPVIITCGIIFIFITSIGMEPWLTVRVLNQACRLCDSICHILLPAGSAGGINTYLSWNALCVITLAIVLLAIALNYRRIWPGIIAAAFVVLVFPVERLSAEPVPSGEMCVPAGTGGLRVVCRTDTVATIYTRAEPGRTLQIYGQSRSRYAEWLVRRGCRGFVLLDSLDAHSPIVRVENHLVCGPVVMAILEHPSDPVSDYCSYCLVATEKADIDSVISRHPGLQLILSPELTAESAAAYVEVCRRRGVKVHNASDSSFMLRW